MKTLKNNISNEIIIKNSKFICYLIKIDSSNINSLLDEIKNIHPKATHYCYGYIYDEVKKSSDDGEPGGTAGLPILNVLEKENLNHVLAVVVRYFGGIKLGAGGLVRAYSKSVLEAIGEAEIVDIEEYDVYEVIFEYADIKLVDSEVRNNNLKSIYKDYSNKVTYHIISKDNKDIEKIFEKYNDKLTVNYKNKQFLEKI